METPSIPVLIVDDDPTVTVLLKGLLRRLGGGLTCEVTAVATGAAAREEFRRGGYTLVLLDYLLPDDDGLALLDAVGALPAEQQPVVIMLTGGGSEQVAVEAMKRGAKDYLVKTAMNLPSLRRSITGALERHRLEEQLARSTAELRRQNTQLEADLTMAREVQQALLPQRYPAFPARAEPGRSRLQFCHRWIPSHKVAGDFFTVFPVSGTTAGVFLCDVMGHGVRAALITALLRGLLREQQALAADPGAFLGELNRQLKALLERAGDLVFVTALYLVADASTGVVRLANAGHPAPLHLQRRRGPVVPLGAADGAGPALGLIPDSTYQTGIHPMEEGDALLLFTDGVYEVEGAVEGEEFGVERLREAAAAALAQPSPLLMDSLLTAAQGFRPAGTDGALADDVCLVTLDYRAPGPD
ncbi:MAG: PP2C family protein-serine/threonine phosphatase [Opitutales bacterium]